MVKSILKLFKKNSKNHQNISFIVGTGRSGTTMLAKILNAHSAICVPPELQILFEYSNNGKKLYDIFKSGNIETYKSKDFINLLSKISPNDLKKYFDYETFFKQYSYPVENLSKMISSFYMEIAKSQNKTIFLEQTPWYGQRLDIIKELFPNAKIIHMVRDGRDVSLSFARTPWWHDDPIRNMDRWSLEVQKISDDLKKYFKKESYLEIKYEDFITDYDKNIQKICELLSVDAEDRMLEPDNMIDYERYCKGVNDKIYSKEFNEWNSQKKSILFSDNIFGWKKDAKQFENLSKENILALIRYGYTVND